MIRTSFRLPAALLLAATLAACGGGDAEIPAASDERPPGEIFRTAEAQLNAGDAEGAAFLFDEIERLYPYSQWAKRAIIMSAFANYQAGLYADSRSSAERYLAFYPTDEDAAYAQYLIALSWYDQISDVGRDQGNTFEALQALRQTIERYPESAYTRDAELKFDLTLDHLAGKEMEIGRYYLKRGHYMAAINRFLAVVEEYQTTSHTPEALHRLVESYLSLGLTDEAQTAGAILGFNFQGSEWYEFSFARLNGAGLSPEATGGGRLQRLYRQVVRGEWL
ncbi:MAG: outer membrane protein assembly factor BamD [Pseudomonadota bacterium]